MTCYVTGRLTRSYVYICARCVHMRTLAACISICARYTVCTCAHVVCARARVYSRACARALHACARAHFMHVRVRAHALLHACARAHYVSPSCNVTSPRPPAPCVCVVCSPACVPWRLCRALRLVPREWDATAKRRLVCSTHTSLSSASRYVACVSTKSARQRPKPK